MRHPPPDRPRVGLDDLFPPLSAMALLALTPSAFASDPPLGFDGASCPLSTCNAYATEWRCNFSANPAHNSVVAWLVRQFDDGNYIDDHYLLFGYIDDGSPSHVPFLCPYSGTAREIHVYGTDGDDVISLSWAGYSENMGRVPGDEDPTSVWVYGKDGDDVIHGSWNAEDDFLQVIYGDGGHDRILMRANGDPENASGYTCPATFDPLSPPTRGAYIFGGEGNDRIEGRNILDCLIDGEEGRDVIYAHGGDDHVHGGAGDDLIAGGDGDDVLWGEGEVDQLHGGPDVDVLCGGDGSAVFYGDDGGDADELWPEFAISGGVVDGTADSADLCRTGVPPYSTFWAGVYATYGLSKPAECP